MRILIITGGRIDEDFALSLLKKEKFEHMIVVDGALAFWDKVEKNPDITCHFDHLVGDFDTISACKYSIPSFLDIGKLYSITIEDCAKPGDEVSELMKIFSSFISDEISNFNTDLYYQNPNYLEWSYREGKLLD